MTNSRETALKMLDRLLAGERDNLPLDMAMILEKSSKLRNTEQHYRQILPEELHGIALTPETVEEIVDKICEGVLLNPDAGLLSAVSTTGTPRVTRVAIDLLTRPPRQLNVEEMQQVLGIIQSFLPSLLSESPDFMTTGTREELGPILVRLLDSPDFVIQRHAKRVLKILGLMKK